MKKGLWTWAEDKKKPEYLLKVNLSVRIPKWLHELLQQQSGSKALHVEKALIEYLALDRQARNYLQEKAANQIQEINLFLEPEEIKIKQRVENMRRGRYLKRLEREREIELEQETKNNRRKR